MKAITQRIYGPPREVLTIGEADRPVPGDGEVLVRVRGSSVNFGDWATTRGMPYLGRLAFGLRRPRHSVPGHDLAGVVEAAGPGVTRFGPGDEVYAEVWAGAYAEYALVREDRLAAKPGNLTFEEAGTVPVAGNTALGGLRGVTAGQRVLINGASGGVGTFAVQIAKALGAEVTGVCSTKNVEQTRTLGADQVIDYTHEDFTQHGDRYDLIFDLVGNRSLKELVSVLTPKGVLVMSSGGGSRWFGPLGRSMGFMLRSPLIKPKISWYMASPQAGNLVTLAELIESGAVRPAVECVYPLSEVPEAVRHFEERHARAKIAIAV